MSGRDWSSTMSHGERVIYMVTYHASQRVNDWGDRNCESEKNRSFGQPSSGILIYRTAGREFFLLNDDV